MTYARGVLIGSMLGVGALILSGCVAGTGGGLSGQGSENSGMAKGRGYFMRECIKCHRYFMPSEKSAGEWPKILAGKKNKVSLTDTQFQELSAYVIAESKAAKAP